LDRNPDTAAGWRARAAACERAGDLAGALQALGQAHALSSDDPDLSKDLARLALLAGMAPAAEALLTEHLRLRPDAADAITNLGIAQREQMKFDSAIETLRLGLAAHPGDALMWSTLATTLSLQGSPAQALAFYDEALRLAPDLANARFNRAKARLAAGWREGIVEEFEAALPGAGSSAEAAAMRVARAHALLALGDLAAGWPAYAARLDPAYGDGVDFQVEAPLWDGRADLAGKRLLLVGEQGLGDEVLFAQALPDVIEAIGSEGKLTLAVEPRLVALFARSFPQAEVGVHASGRAAGRNTRNVPFLDGRWDGIEIWAPLGSILAPFRSDLARFGTSQGYLRPDPARVAVWRDQLAALGPGPKVGILWKSLVMDAERARWFAPFAAWAPVLATPGVRFVNLQYGDSGAEAAWAAAALGVELWTPAGLDRLNDLDELTALCCALDLVIGPANATTNLAGAAGAPLWLIASPGTWPRLGAEGYPWYPQARVFAAAGLEGWGPVMGEIAGALEAWAG
jgi:tetratricopeptide (TPR) repeat protein